MSKVSIETASVVMRSSLWVTKLYLKWSATSSLSWTGETAWVHIGRCLLHLGHDSRALLAFSFDS